MSKEKQIVKVDWKRMKAVIIGIILGLVIFFCLIHVFLRIRQIPITTDYICKYYDKNKTKCFCGDTYQDGTFEYMHFGEVVKTDYNTFCCVATHSSCEKIKE